MRHEQSCRNEFLYKLRSNFNRAGGKRASTTGRTAADRFYESAAAGYPAPAGCRAGAANFFNSAASAEKKQ